MHRAGPILIAGKRGRLAHALITQAAEQSRHVVAVGRPDLDLLDRASIARTLAEIKPRAIINTAGIVNMEQAEREPALAFAVNRDAAANLAAAVAPGGILWLGSSEELPPTIAAWFDRVSSHRIYRRRAWERGR